MLWEAHHVHPLIFVILGMSISGWTDNGKFRKVPRRYIPSNGQARANKWISLLIRDSLETEDRHIVAIKIMFSTRESVEHAMCWNMVNRERGTGVDFGIWRKNVNSINTEFKWVNCWLSVVNLWATGGYEPPGSSMIKLWAKSWVSCCPSRGSSFGDWISPCIPNDFLSFRLSNFRKPGNWEHSRLRNFLNISLKLLEPFESIHQNGIIIAGCLK